MNIFVGCASRLPQNKEYQKLAEDIGNFIVEGKHNLVFGAYNHGLMGTVYSVVEKTMSSDVIAVTCKRFEADLEELSYKEPAYVSDTIAGRKDCFNNVSDVLLFIPGGIGTLDEIVSAIESKRNEEHNLPIIIINQNGFFDHLLNMFEKIYDEKFSDGTARKLYIVVDNFEEALPFLKSFEILTDVNK